MSASTATPSFATRIGEERDNGSIPTRAHWPNRPIGEAPPRLIRSYIKYVHDKVEQLAALSPGGSARWAITVASASVIESRAARMACPRCNGEYRIHEHTRPVPGLRRVDVTCRHCSAPRTLWFRIVDDELN